jgi:DNA helicase IV
MTSPGPALPATLSVSPAAGPSAGPRAELPAELCREREHHDLCRAALTAMIDGAGEHVVTGQDVSASGADAEVLGRQLRTRARDMGELPEGPLFFGRLDFTAGPGREHGGQSYHVGRLRIADDPTAPPLVVDWRAPVSRAFYRAGSRDPQGVAVRRRFGWAAGSRGASADLTGMEDEYLEAAPGHGSPEAPGATDEPPLPATVLGGDLLSREIERPRVGPMRDIAATIQPEQDELVRAALDVSFCVQGAPGTGKTAVGLHRAAYLLYTHPQRIRRSGLLILGPNRTFLAYIAEVLPALGETGVRQTTLHDEIARVPVTGHDDDRAAALKHDVRMAEVLRRALYARVSADGISPVVVPEGSYRWRVPVGELVRIVDGVRAEEPPYRVGRERVRTRAVRHLRAQAEQRTGVRPESWVRRVASSRAVGEYVDAAWPKAKPEEVLAELFTDPAALSRAADGLLDAGEQEALRWPKPPRSFRSARWSAADVVLLDEIAGLLERPDGYAHVVVDEAQDLSPMECRAIARRASFGSLTVLGDLAQGTTPWAARDWPAHLAHLGKPEAAVLPLTIGFRVPPAVVGLTNRLLARLDVGLAPSRSLRRDGELRLLPVPDAGALPAAVVDAVRDALTREGSVAVITADADVQETRATLTAAGIAVADHLDPAARPTVLPAGLAKGLEYDHVVAVEPAAIAEAEERGPHRLYVVLTRAVSGLDVVHARELPF